MPVVLNTSFNTLKSEPITETPRNAVRSFLSSMGTIEMLVMGDYVIKTKGGKRTDIVGRRAEERYHDAAFVPKTSWCCQLQDHLFC